MDDDVVESLDLQKEVWRPQGRLASAVPSAVPSAGGVAIARTTEVQAKAEAQAKAEVQAKAEAPAEQLTEQLKLEREVAARALDESMSILGSSHDESMSILGSSHDESMPRIDDGRLVEEPTAFPRVTLKFEGETHRHGR